MEIDLFGSNASFHHLGMGFKNIPAELREMEYFNDHIQKVTVGFSNLNGCPIEIVVPLEKEAPIMASLKKGNKLLHLCYEVDDLKIAISNAISKGCIVIAEPVEAIAFQNRKIAWLYHANYGLLELLERSKLGEI